MKSKTVFHEGCVFFQLERFARSLTCQTSTSICWVAHAPKYWKGMWMRWWWEPTPKCLTIFRFLFVCVSLSRQTVQEWSLFLAMGSLYFLLHLHFSLLVAPDLYVIWVLERFDLSVELFVHFVPTLLTATQLAAKKWGHEGSWICIPHPQDSSSACLGIEFAEKPVTIFTTCLMILSYDVICALYVFVCAKCLWKKCFKGRIHPPQEKGAEREAGHRKNEWIQEESRQRCRISAESEWGW